MSPHQTRFSDVCGTMDELKRLLHEEYERVRSNPAGILTPLLEDALFMLGRMKKRLAEYGDFRQQIHDVVTHLEAMEDIDLQKAHDAVALLREHAQSTEGCRNSDVKRMEELAEDIRSVASAEEHALRNYKDLALKLHGLFIGIKGNRPWAMTQGEAESPADVIKRRYQAWLPPEPHCSALLDRFSESKARVLDEPLPDGQPVVQFVDGGRMPMSKIRWDPDIRNFHDASFTPDPTARKYRRRSRGGDEETDDT